MSVVTFKITRSSVNDNFLHEITSALPLFNIDKNYIDTPFFALGGIGYINSTIDEFISWKEIYSRKDELRSDLLDWVNSSTNKFLIESNSQLENDPSYGPLFNPFSTTFTKRTQFDTVENALEYIKYLVNPGNFDYDKILSDINNTVEIYVDDNFVDWHSFKE